MMDGKIVTWDGEDYRIVLTHPPVRSENGTRGIPVTAVRTERGQLVLGLENLTGFMLDGEAALAGTIKVLAKR